MRDFWRELLRCQPAAALFRRKRGILTDTAGHPNMDESLDQKLAKAGGDFETYLGDDSLQAAYQGTRQDILRQEAETAWCSLARDTASEAEVLAAKIIWQIREHERNHLFGDKASEAIPGPDTRDMGGQFLTNLDRIDRSRIFSIAQRMPKGCHLHVHFNAELPPRMLVERARSTDAMFVRSNRPLLHPPDFKEAEMVFNVLPVTNDSANIFSSHYNPDVKAPGNNPWMKWNEFRSRFPSTEYGDVETWVEAKMVLSEKEVYDVRQTLNGYISIIPD